MGAFDLLQVSKLVDKAEPPSVTGRRVKNRNIPSCPAKSGDRMSKKSEKRLLDHGEALAARPG